MSTNKAHYFYKKLTTGPGSSSGLESTEPANANLLNDDSIKERLEKSKRGLYKFIENYADNDKELKKKVRGLLKNAVDPLKAVAELNADYLEGNNESSSLLEVIVQTDGSRPSFLVKNDKVDLKSFDPGEWENALAQGATRLGYTLQCIGRVSVGPKYYGTGFLVDKNIIITNRHVLQLVATEDASGNWTFHPGAQIDFGFEYKTRLSVTPRLLHTVIFCIPERIIQGQVDHNKADIAVIEVEKVDLKYLPKTILEVDNSATWAWPDTMIYTIGYPGDPGLPGILNYTEEVLELIFKQTYGHKRLAPGRVRRSPGERGFPISLTHDATTLGGNSGSVIITRGHEQIASGLHYGGEVAQPRENWGHTFEKLFSKKNKAGKTLLECLQDYPDIQYIKSDV